jgi:diamine N-acetyltransferase
MTMMTGKKVILRALEPGDADILYRWENDMSVWHLSSTIVPLSLYSIEQYIINSADLYAHRQLRFIIEGAVHEIEHKTIGAIDLFEFEPAHMRAGIGILVDDRFRGRGFASEALDLLIEYAFNTLHLHQVFCNISPDNVESLNLFKSRGFLLVGTKKEWNKVRNSWQDECMFQLLNSNNNKTHQP